MRQLQQHVPAAVRQRQRVAGRQPLHEAVLDPHVAARQHGERNPRRSQRPLQLAGPPPHVVAPIVREGPQLVRRDDHRPHAVGHRHLRHRQGRGHVPGAVIDGRQHMAVDVHKGGIGMAQFDSQTAATVASASVAMGWFVRREP